MAAVANAEHRRPEATARNAKVAVDYTIIRAPFDGVILSKSANVGDLVTPFSNAADSKGAVVSMADMSTLEVEADVSGVEPRQGQGRPAGGDRPRRAAGLRASAAASATHGPDVDRSKATVMTKVKFDAIDPRILPEMSAKVSFLSQEVTPEQRSRCSR